MKKMVSLFSVSFGLLTIMAGFNNFAFVHPIRLGAKPNITPLEPAGDEASQQQRLEPQQPRPERMVWIEGKPYAYNPKNVYYVRGVPTYFVAGSGPRPAKTTAKAEVPDESVRRPKVRVDPVPIDPSIYRDAVGSDDLEKFGQQQQSE